MSEKQNIVKRYPILSFAILSYLLSWWPWFILSFRESGFRVLPHGPSIAAIIVTSIVGGGPAVKLLLSRWVRWRFAWYWYIIAIGGTAVLALATVWLNVLLGAQAPTAEQWGTWTELPFNFVFMFFMFGAAEELGWRGFAQQRLQQNRSALGAALIVATIGVIWHLPLFVDGRIELPDIVAMTAGYIVWAWLFDSTGGSVLITMLAHATNNAVGGEWAMSWFTGADSVRNSALLAVIYVLVAILVIALAGPAHLSRRQAEEVALAA